METLYQLIAFATFGLLATTLYRLGYLKALRPSSVFFLFFVLQYGPLFLLDVRHPQNDNFISTFHISDFGSTIAKYTYAALAISYVGLTLGLISAGRAVSLRRPDYSSYRSEQVYVDPQSVLLKRLYLLLVLMIIVSSALFLSLDIIQQKISFFRSLLAGHIGAADYTTFRRITLSNDPSYKTVIKLRMNFSLPLLALMTAVGLYIARPKLEILAIGIVFTIIAILDLTKQGSVVALLIVIMTVYLTRRKGKLPPMKALLIPGAVIGAAGVSLLLALYAVQYMSFDLGDLWSTLVYRVVRINGDVLNLYFVFFPNPIFFRGVTTSSTLASLFNKQMLDETQYIPQVYGAVTSFTTVFFSGMWVDFGWIGIAVSSFLVGVICVVADRVTSLLRCIPVKAAYVACMLFSLNYFAQNQFLTCLVSYGVVSIMIGAILLDYILVRMADETDSPLQTQASGRPS